MKKDELLQKIAVEKVKSARKDAWILWVAQGFGVGRISFCPGTWGSLVGLIWFLVLWRTQSIWIYAAGCLLGFLLSVWLSGKAEIILGQTDPCSIVLDEISAVPVCFAGWMGLEYFRRQTLPEVEPVFQSYQWLWLLVVVALFRIFDIVKPWPIRQTQLLPGGWGVTVDDFLVALIVSLISLVTFL